MTAHHSGPAPAAPCLAVLVLLLSALPLAGGTLGSGPVQTAESRQSSDEPWWNTDFPYRMQFKVGPQPYDWREMPASWVTHLGKWLEDLGLPSEPVIDPATFRLVEVTSHDQDGEVIENFGELSGEAASLVPVRFHRYLDRPTPIDWNGQLEWNMPGETSAGEYRYFARPYPEPIEELVRAAERGAAFPESVLATVQARLEELEAPARLVLRAASVLGERFWTGAVAELVGAAESAIDVER